MENKISGVSPDAPIVENARGGKQSATDYAFHLLDHEAMFALTHVLAYGAKRYAPNNWRKISTEDHFNHMLIHAFAYMSGDRQDDHLGHMLCRAMFMFATAKADERAKTYAPEPLPRIVAVDFDGCLCTNKWPEIGEPNLPLIDRLKQHRLGGGKLILWTCREGRALADAIEWCAGHGLFFDAANTNLPEQNELYGNDSRKVGADIYIDDKSAQVVAHAE